MTLIIADNIELRAGARILMSEISFHVNQGDKIGLVGRNGAGKTTLTKVLAGDAKPYQGTVKTQGVIGYLPQDPRVGNIEQIARDRILSARDLDVVIRKLRQAEEDMASENVSVHEKAMKEYPKLEARFMAQGGYTAESEAATIAANLGLPDKILAQPLKTLSGGQRRRIELARILFSNAQTLLLDEPTNHLDADSIEWLRGFLSHYSGGLIIISHDVDLIRATVNKIFYLDAQRSTIDMYNMGWDKYLATRESDEKRRKKERANAQKKASTLVDQANKMRAKATKAVAAQNMLKRAERLMKAVKAETAREQVANIKFPDPAPCGKTPLFAEGLSKSYGSQEIFVDVNVAVDRGSRIIILGLNGAGKTTLLRMLAQQTTSDSGSIQLGHGAKLGYYAQEHETLDTEKSVRDNMALNSPHLDDVQVRSILGSFMFSGEDVQKPAGVLSGGEKTRLALAILVASSANVLLLDEPTNNLDPASRQEILAALRTYTGAIVMISHDEGAVEALNPERVIVMPDGDEDLWSRDYLELIELA